MKKKLFGILTALLLMACGSQSTTGGSDYPDNYDSLVIQIDSIGVLMTFKVDYPVNDTVLQHQLASQIAGKFFYTEDDEAVVVIPPYEGDFRKFLQACAFQRWNELANNTYEDFPEAVGEEEEGISRSEMQSMATEQKLSLSSCEMLVRHEAVADGEATWTTMRYWHVNNTAHPSIDEDTIKLNKN